MPANNSGKPLRGLRKAAIVLDSLDGEQADVLMRALSPSQAHLVRDELARLGPIDEHERQKIVDEFLRAVALVPGADVAGIELDAPLPPTLNARGAKAESASAMQDMATPFRFLHEAAPRKLVPFLEREHPQTVAVVLSHLPAQRAADVLTHLSGGLQVEVARRLVDLEETDPDVLREVERGLESWLSSQARTPAGAGLATPLATILGAADPQARQSILSNLARHDRRLVDQLDAPAEVPPSFADLEQLDAKSLAVVLRHADDELLTLALAGASHLFAERVLGQLGANATAIRQGMKSLGALRMGDIETAQRQLAELAQDLERRGEIRPEPWGRLSLAV